MDILKSFKFLVKRARNNKNKEIYELLDVEVLDCTNARDGLKVVLYHKNGKFFIRDFTEFNEKFTMIGS